MDYDGGPEASVSSNDVNIDVPVVESHSRDGLDRVSSGELENVREVIIDVESDLARAADKLQNLSGFMMRVATKESDFEAFVSKEEEKSVDCVEKALEYTLLSGILDSEVSELDKLMAMLQMEITAAQGILSSYTYLGETFAVMEEKLQYSEQSLKQLQEQVSEIRMQSLKFQRTFSSSDGEEKWNNDKELRHIEDELFSSKNVQTVEQQRHILQMLEKSIAREMDLEKKLVVSKQIEEDLKMRLLSSEEEAYCMEDEAADVWERCLEADNASGIMMSISKELLGKLQILQFNLNGLVQRENELQLKVDGLLKAKESSLQKLESSNAKVNDFFHAQTESLKDSLKEAEDKLIFADSQAFTLSEKVSSLEDEISEMGIVISDLKEKESKAESRARNAEAQCKLLTETNSELNEELGLLKVQLTEPDMRLQHAVATAEASQEKQNMLNSTIRDMENVIKDLKLKVSKAECRADSVEDKCIILSESNAALNDEVSFLTGRLKRMEAALHQAEAAKIATATDIAVRSKVITNLIVQLAFERERLHKQMSSLTMENKTLILKLQMNNSPSVVMCNDDRGNDDDCMLSKHELDTGTKESREEAHELSAVSAKFDRTHKDAFMSETEAGPADFVRRVDAGVLNFKHVLMAVLIVLISAALYFFT
ncbi:PREDICTED: WPP domain-interacting tail-anchored protein 1 [Fragaria vesca subsp. vesca]|uniref:WPP domain-interacting tail-anchored protein 1 n=1 Tax=Fragaria vesca subsp. vesca TaxID=101020 RepID=UPI0002C2EC27|nr:PREDICTED: WPP domain-interacting tail-anchored protein 1 [Fragaria vesca subsp. vesca]XP_011467849.1 PREDICTED: WPP domain-interacting tail-anchored protein 1 [Fragaria vesca subsp. vesca]